MSAASKTWKGFEKEFLLLLVKDFPATVITGKRHLKDPSASQRVPIPDSGSNVRVRVSYLNLHLLKKKKRMTAWIEWKNPRN